MIEAEGLSKRFSQVAAVSDLSFQARDGQITGLLGPNGAGKSTCLRMVYGVLTPDSGRACIDGIDIAGETSAARSRLGVLPHAAGLYGNLTARENIVYFGRLQGIEAAVLERRARELAETLGMQDFLERRVKGFSQGQRMKTALARALVHGPQNLVLDEPTNGLDVESTHLFYDLISETAAQGTTVLFSTHLMDHVTRLCSHAVIVNEGTVVAKGSIAELSASFGEASLEEIFLQLTARPPQR